MNILWTLAILGIGKKAQKIYRKKEKKKGRKEDGKRPKRRRKKERKNEKKEKERKENTGAKFHDPVHKTKNRKQKKK